MDRAKVVVQVHDDRLVYLLPKMSPENLDVADLQSGNLSMHEYPCEVKLNLKSNINIGPVNCRRPPKSETTIWNLVQSRALCIG